MSGKWKVAVDYSQRGLNAPALFCGGVGKEPLLSPTSALLLLSFLSAHDLVCVFDAFAFVRLRWPIGADLGSDLTDALTVGTTDGDYGRPLTDDPDILRDRERDIVAVAQL